MLTMWPAPLSMILGSRALVIRIRPSTLVSYIRCQSPGSAAETGSRPNALAARERRRPVQEGGRARCGAAVTVRAQCGGISSTILDRHLVDAPAGPEACPRLPLVSQELSLGRKVTAISVVIVYIVPQSSRDVRKRIARLAFWPDVR